MVKPVAAILAAGLVAAAGSPCQARGGGQFGQGHPTRFHCPPQTRVERFFVGLTHACRSVAAARPPAPKPAPEPSA